MGYQTTALGNYSTATGYQTNAKGNFSTATGSLTIAHSGYEMVLGRWNTEYVPENTTGWHANDRLFVIGNGISSSDLRNAMVVLKNGNIGIGTSSPTAKLHTTGSVRFEALAGSGTRMVVADANGYLLTQKLAYSVGDFAHGGIVFWVDETGQHGLVAAKTDQSTLVRWSAGTSGNTQAKGDGPFAGEANTSIIISAHVAIGDDGNTYAARICNELQVTEGGKTYGDWYLPSKEELNLMYINRTAINNTATANGGSAFAGTFYWSSTEEDNHQAWQTYFPTGSQNPNPKYFNRRVRAIRAF